MVFFNNRYISSYRIIFFLVDTTLLVGAVALGYYIRFLGGIYPIALKYILARGVCFAYFELYELKIIRQSAKFVFRFLQSVAGSFVVLMIVYYVFPELTIGRGALLVAMSTAAAGVFLWRIIYRNFVKGSQLNERIIILGTGEFAREIARQIRDKGDSGFEVIGHIVDKKVKEGEA